MGGSSYDRDVYSSSSSSGWGTSYTSRSAFTSSRLDPSMNPNGKIVKSDTMNPVVLWLDVTGSNIDFARLVYDKLPMFYGQIEQQGYLKDFDIFIGAVGDAYCDDYPLQVGDFAKGSDLDDNIQKLVLEAGGGGGIRESYELAACYTCQNFEFKPGAKPIIFFIADEAPYDYVDMSQAKEVGIVGQVPDEYPFKVLADKYDGNIYCLLNKYGGNAFRSSITDEWTNVLPPEHVIKIQEEKSIVDLMLGIIAMCSKSRTLKSYKVDMLERGQTKERIERVSKSLDGLSKALVPTNVTNVNLTNTKSTKKEGNKGKRI